MAHQPQITQKFKRKYKKVFCLLPKSVYKKRYNFFCYEECEVGIVRIGSES